MSKILLTLFIGLSTWTVSCGETNSSGEGGSAAETTKEPLPPLEGDFSCFAPGQSWIEQSPIADAGVIKSVEVQAVPLGGDEGEIAPEVEISIWYDNSTSGDANANGVTNQDGAVSLDLPTCTPLAYRAVRTMNTEITYKAHLIIDPENPTLEVIVVETLTSASIEAILNEAIGDSSSLVAGTAYDCSGEPILNARARIRDGSGELIANARDYYFNDSEFPTKTKNRSFTNVGGKWVVFNLPIGEVTVEIYGNICADGECEEVILGTTPIKSVGDSVNIGNVYAGHNGGVRFPSSCLE